MKKDYISPKAYLLVLETYDVVTFSAVEGQGNVREVGWITPTNSIDDLDIG